jgi:Arc/MetJ-type ribon-helix-helix transcriptional regulator
VSEQIAVRFSDETAETLEALVASGRFSSKADAIRAGVESFLEAERRRRVGELIAEGYRRVPQRDAGLDAALDAASADVARALDAEDGGW